MRRFLLFLLISSICLVASLFCNNGVLAQNENHYSLQLQGFVWDHTTLNTLIVTAANESWWNNMYLNTAVRAIGQWNEALAAFSANYSDYSYLSNLKIQPTVSNITEPGFDIYIQWSTYPPSASADEIGLSQISANYENAITNCTITLSAHSQHGDSLNEVDSQNVALHELGHSLGLGHCNYTGDLMNAYYTRGNPPEKISTLDTYGVAKIFYWETNSVNLFPIDRWFNENPVTLPSNVTYQGLPVSAKNSVSQTFADSPAGQTLILMFELLIHPEILAVVIVFIVVLVVVVLIATRKRSLIRVDS
jgi:Matrixin